MTWRNTLRQGLPGFGVSSQEIDELERVMNKGLNLDEWYPDEKNAQSIHYNSLKKYVKHLRASTDAAPIMLAPGSGKPMNCGPNCKRFIQTHPGHTLVRGYKVFVAMRDTEIVGMKAVCHFVVKDPLGVLIDVTQEPDDRDDTSKGVFKIMFVPSASACDDRTDVEILNGCNTYGYKVYGDESYIQAVHLCTRMGS